MQQIRNINKFIIIICNLIELILINYFINFNFQYNLSNNKYGFIRVNLVVLIIDVIYFLYLCYFSIFNKDYNPLKSYKKDSNYNNIISFLPFHAIKTVVLFFLIPKVVFYYSYYYKKLIIYELIPVLLFYFLYLLFPKGDNVYKKCKLLKRALKNEYLFGINFIYNHGDYSTFNLLSKSQYKIDNNNIYINDYDINYLKKKGYNVDQFINRYINCEISYLKNDRIDDYLDLLNRTSIDDFKKNYIFVVKNKNNIKNKKINIYNAVQVVNDGEEIEYVENLLLRDTFETIPYDIAKRYSFDLLSLYKNTKVTCVPSDKGLFNMYKNAYYKDSAYQSILGLFNYSSSLLRLVATYYYCKNNNINFESDVDLNLVTDQYNVLYNFIKDNIKENDYLFDSFYNGRYYLDEKNKGHLFKDGLKYLLDCEVIGDYLDLFKLIDILKLLRNKVEAHGSMTDYNIYLVWYLIAILTDALNYLLMVDKLVLNTSKKEIFAHYDSDNINSLGKYIIVDDDMICYLVTVHKLKRDNFVADTYINYLTGNADIKLK